MCIRDSFDGKFTLQNVPDNGTIQVSFVGYKTVDIQVQGQSTVKVILEEDTDCLLYTSWTLSRTADPV